MQGSELLIDEEEERKAKKQLSSLREKPSDVIAGFLVICDSSFARQVVSKSKTGSDWKVAFHVNCAPELGFAPSLSLETVSVKYKVKDPLEQLELFRAIARKIKQRKPVDEEGTICLINCARGRSRSVAVCLFYLMSEENMTLREAYVLVKQCRPFAGPSRHLQMQLHHFELELRGEASFQANVKWAQQIT